MHNNISISQYQSSLYEYVTIIVIVNFCKNLIKICAAYQYVHNNILIV